MGGTVDIFHSRRGMFQKCLFWQRDEKQSLSNLAEWTLKNKPSGVFYAKEVSALSHQTSPVNNVIMLDRNLITLQCNDDLTGICRGCVVQYNGHLWMVDSVQREVHSKQSEFSSRLEYVWYLSIRN